MRLLPHLPYAFNQNRNFKANCACRGSPTPCRRNPSKLKSPGVESGLTLLALLKVLNNSNDGISWYLSPNVKGRASRQSKEKYLLSFRRLLRLVAVLMVGVIGWAERA